MLMGVVVSNRADFFFSKVNSYNFQHTFTNIACYINNSMGFKNILKLLCEEQQGTIT